MEEKPDKKLIRETVKNKLRVGAVLRKMALAAVFALIFGVVAALAFTVSRPVWEDMMSEEVTTTAIRIFEEPTSEVTTEAPTEEPTTEPVTEITTEASAGETISPEMREYVNEKINSKFTMDSLYDTYRRVAQAAAGSIVTITSTDSTDLLDQQVSVESESCGVVIAVTDTRLYILMSKEDIPESGELYASFTGGTVPASIEGTDKVFGIAVITVNISDIPEENRDISAITMGSSLVTSQGTPVIALGKPSGINRSIMYGTVTYIESNAQTVDGSVRLFQTDMSSCDESRGILVNSEGELVGIISDKYEGYSEKGYITAVSLYDLQTSIETLSNGKHVAILGIHGQTVSRTLYEQQGIPVGVYVTEAIYGYPAEESGIIAGDVITAIGDKEISTLSGMTSAIYSGEPGAEVEVTVSRNNRGSWKELKFSVILGSR